MANLNNKNGYYKLVKTMKNSKDGDIAILVNGKIVVKPDYIIMTWHGECQILGVVGETTPKQILKSANWYLNGGIAHRQKMEDWDFEMISPSPTKSEIAEWEAKPARKPRTE